ncbi:MAG: HAD-IA family hydrolase [Polyangiaceae bacterium]|nr:HAD-IA family hydrolase [Polyangiaceae bacterium]
MSSESNTLTIEELLQDIDALIFDLDGVLLASEGVYTQATMQALGPHGSRFNRKIKEKLMGRSQDEATRILLEELKLSIEPEVFLQKFTPLLERSLSQTPALPGARKFILAMHQRGLPLVVATSSDRRLFELKSQGHEFFNSFDRIVCGDDPEVKNYKPAPDIFLVAAEYANCHPKRTIIFEDSPAGLEAAHAAEAGKIIQIRPPLAGSHAFVEPDLIFPDFQHLASLC